jgi:dihydrofolate reductase
MNDKPKAVFSHTLERADWGPAEIFGGDLSTGISDLKARDDEGTILVHGGPDCAKSLTRLGLVDEYQLSTVPIAIGAGRSPFADPEGEPEARGRGRATLPERSPRADPGAEAMSDCPRKMGDFEPAA